MEIWTQYEVQKKVLEDVKIKDFFLLPKHIHKTHIIKNEAG